MAEKVKVLWKDPAITAAWAQRSTLQVSESVSTFVDRINKFAKPNCIPSLEEVNIYMQRENRGGMGGVYMYIYK
jgi:hypothetical protein